jgi:riboflavin kinase/FMN adenylyltransferase
MRLIRGLNNLNRQSNLFHQGCVLTIGNFDGVHLGHQKVLQAVHEKAKQLSVPSVVMVFEPLPIEYFAPEKAPVRLMNLREKIQAFQASDIAIDYVVCLKFTRGFSELTASKFIEQILLKSLNIKHLVVGDDFHFGKGRQGNFSTLETAGKTYGFEVTDMPTLLQMDERISSTRIRKALAKPCLETAQKLLGQKFRFNGRVIHGQKLGRTIGFPTLNINPKRTQMPVSGVFSVSVTGIDDQPWPGVANIGLRPTLDGFRPSIEVHLFNWRKMIYGQHIGVVLESFIRQEMKFNGLDELTQQIRQDAEVAKAFFKI